MAAANGVGGDELRSGREGERAEERMRRGRERERARGCVALRGVV